LSGIDQLKVIDDYLGEWRWERFTPDGTVVAVCGYGYTSFENCVEAAQRINAMPYHLEVVHDRLPSTADPDLDIREAP
jgi:hypothetical protein